MSYASIWVRWQNRASRQADDPLSGADLLFRQPGPVQPETQKTELNKIGIRREKWLDMLL
jgi:hypothetical protein